MTQVRKNSINIPVDSIVIRKQKIKYVGVKTNSDYHACYGFLNVRKYFSVNNALENTSPSE